MKKLELFSYGLVTIGLGTQLIPFITRDFSLSFYGVLIMLSGVIPMYISWNKQPIMQSNKSNPEGKYE